MKHEASVGQNKKIGLKILDKLSAPHSSFLKPLNCRWQQKNLICTQTKQTTTQHPPPLFFFATDCVYMSIISISQAEGVCHSYNKHWAVFRKKRHKKKKKTCWLKKRMIVSHGNRSKNKM